MLDIELAANRSAQNRQKALKALAIFGALLAALLMYLSAREGVLLGQFGDSEAISIPANEKPKAKESFPENWTELEPYVPGLAQSDSNSSQDQLERDKEQIIRELNALGRVPTLASTAFDLLYRVESEPFTEGARTDAMAVIQRLRIAAESERSAVETKAMLAISGYNAENAAQLVQSLRRLKAALAGENEQFNPPSKSELQEVLEALKSAEREENPSLIQSTADALEKILPEFASKIQLLEESLVREVIQKRIEVLQQSLANAISDQDFPAAERKLSQLKSLGGSQASISTFRRMLVEGRNEILATSLIDAAENSYSQGDIAAAMSSAEKAVELDASNARARAALSQYRFEDAFSLKANVFLDQPHRLSSENVMVEAKALSAKLSSNETPFLSELAARLDRLISDYSKTFTLVVNSDGVARIELVGVGFIEPALARRVKLTRGTYTLVARCRGHQDKAAFIDQDVEVLPNTTIETEIGCGPKLN